MFLLILVQIYKKNRGKPHVERNIYKEKNVYYEVEIDF